MDKDLLEKLYDIFASTNKTNMFSRFSFNRRMNGKKTMDALSNLENFLNNVARKFHSSQASSEEELATIYLRLCETFSEKDLQQLLSSVIPESRGYFLTPDESAKAQEVEESNKKIEKQILESLGLGDDIDFELIPKYVLTRILMQPKGMVSDLYSMYKDTIFEMHS